MMPSDTSLLKETLLTVARLEISLTTSSIGDSISITSAKKEAEVHRSIAKLQETLEEKELITYP